LILFTFSGSARVDIPRRLTDPHLVWVQSVKVRYFLIYFHLFHMRCARHLDGKIRIRLILGVTEIYKVVVDGIIGYVRNIG